MSPTASVMSVVPTISTTRTSEHDNASVDYPQTPATTVTNQSFPLSGHRTMSQVSSLSGKTPTSPEDREPPQQYGYVPHQTRYPSLTLSDSAIVPENEMNNSNVSLDRVPIPKKFLDENAHAQKRSANDQPYELEATTTVQILPKSVYSPFPSRTRNSSTAREDISQPADSSDPENPPLRRGEILRGDSPILGIDPARSSKEERGVYGKPRPPPLTPPPPIPRDRVIRGQGKQTVRSDLPLRKHPNNLVQGGKPSVLPQSPVQASNADRGGESIGVNTNGNVRTQGGMPPRSDLVVKKKEMGIYNENQERLRSEDGMPLEIRLRNLEGLVRKLEVENARTAEKMLAKRVGSEGRATGLMK